jgi:SpoU rRNA methylase family enzyme
MYCKPGKYTITVEDTLELLFVRVKKEAEGASGTGKKVDEKERLEEEIRVIFGGEEKTADGLEREVTFKEYLDKINQRAIDKRKEQLLHKGKFDA